jgi:hypothetical protein
MGSGVTRTIQRRQQVRRAYSDVWVEKDHVLLEGEIGFEIDTNKIKIGNGINSWTNLEYLTGSGGGGATQTVTDYRSEFESDLYIYSGYLLDDNPIISRTIDNTIEIAQNVTDLETDWINKLTLTYI